MTSVHFPVGLSQNDVLNILFFLSKLTCQTRLRQNHPSQLSQDNQKMSTFIISANSMLLLWKEQYLEWILLGQNLSSRWRVVRQTSPVVVCGWYNWDPWLFHIILLTVPAEAAMSLFNSVINNDRSNPSLLSEHILTQRWISVSNPFRSRHY